MSQNALNLRYLFISLDFKFSNSAINIQKMLHSVKRKYK